MPAKCCELKSLGLKTNLEAKKFWKTRHSLDQKFEDRMKQYIQENKHKSFIDAGALVDSLREQYPEYLRRQKAAVKYLAGRVFAKLMAEEEEESKADEETTVEPTASDSEDKSNLSSISSEDEMSSANVSTPNINDTILEMYKATQSNASLDDENIEENHISFSGSKITLDYDQVKPAGDRSAQAKKRKHSEQSEFTVTPKIENVCQTNGDIAATNSDENTPVCKNCKKQKNRIPTPASKKNILNSSKKSTNLDESRRPMSASIPSIKLKDIAGYWNVKLEIFELLLPMYRPEVCSGVKPPRGILLHGPPGCGKTSLAKAVAGQLEIPLLNTPAPELVAGISGLSEQKIRKLFEDAIKQAPCVVFIDEIDCITKDRDAVNREMEQRIVCQLVSSFDKLNEDEKGPHVLVIGATNRLDSLDRALRRAGRFDREVCMGIPDEESRFEILEHLCSEIRLADDLDLMEMASKTPGYVGADLLSLTNEMKRYATRRMIDQVFHNNSKTNISAKLRVEQLLSLVNVPHIEPQHHDNDRDLRISRDDFLKSLKSVQPSSKREGFATVPDVTWDDIGSLNDIREKLKENILNPINYPITSAELAVKSSAGILLYGPPGCGKTLLAKAIANEANINFISVKGPELLNMYVGGSEKAVRECFQRARNSKPCVIFFDELDSLCPKRAKSSENKAESRVVNQLLTEMDGFQERAGVFVMAATNRPNLIDEAILRPGRLDKILYVGFPNEVDRIEILRALTKNGTTPRLHEDVSLEEIAKNPLCDGFTGADLAALVNDAKLLTLSEFVASGRKDNDPTPVFVTKRNCDRALQNIRPSVTKKARKHYEKLRIEFATSIYQMQKEVENLKDK